MKYIPGTSSLVPHMPHLEEMEMDGCAKEDKKKILHNQWWNSFFLSLSEPLKYIAGILTAVGVANAVTPFVNGLQKVNGSLFDLASLKSAFAEVDSIGIALLGASALAIGAATVAGFISNRIYHSVTYDNLDTQAKHMAKYLAKELQKEAPAQPQAIVLLQPENQRSDGKTWQDVVAAQRANG